MALTQAEDKLAQAKRVASEERAALLEDAEAAAAVARAQNQIIEELRAIEVATKRELEKSRQN